MPDGRCLAPNHVEFDSIENDPNFGNEAYFMGAKVLGGSDAIRRIVRVKIGDTVLVRGFIENDAAMNQAHSRSLVASGTRFNLSIPTNSSSELPLIGHISAANAEPARIYATVMLRSTQRFAIEYGWRSATLSNHVHKGLQLSDDIVGEGALVGADHPDGRFPPGLSNGAAVFLLVHIVPPSA